MNVAAVYLAPMLGMYGALPPKSRYAAMSSSFAFTGVNASRLQQLTCVLHCFSLNARTVLREGIFNRNLKINAANKQTQGRIGVVCSCSTHVV